MQDECLEDFPECNQRDSSNPSLQSFCCVFLLCLPRFVERAHHIESKQLGVALKITLHPAFRHSARVAVGDVVDLDWSRLLAESHRVFTPAMVLSSVVIFTPGSVPSLPARWQSEAPLIA